MRLSIKNKRIIIFVILNIFLYSGLNLRNVILANEQNDLEPRETGQISFVNNIQDSKEEKIQGSESVTERVSYNNAIVSVQDITIELYQNEICFLPGTVKAKLSNGKTASVKVDWSESAVDSTRVEGYSIFGKVNGYKKDVKCSIIVKPKEELLGKLIVFPDGEYDKIEAQAIKDRISKIYPGILNKMIKKNIRVKLITTNITELPEYAYLKGLVPRGWEGSGKTWEDVPGVCGNPIAIKIGFSERGKGHGSINLELHETAHTIDGYILNMVSKTKQFEDAWKGEVNELFPESTYFESYPDEYFAETFAMFYLDGNSKYELSLKAPKTFKFFENLEESFYIKL